MDANANAKANASANSNANADTNANVKVDVSGPKCKTQTTATNAHKRQLSIASKQNESVRAISFGRNTVGERSKAHLCISIANVLCVAGAETSFERCAAQVSSNSN